MSYRVQYGKGPAGSFSIPAGWKVEEDAGGNLIFVRERKSDQHQGKQNANHSRD